MSPSMPGHCSVQKPGPQEQTVWHDQQAHGEHFDAIRSLNSRSGIRDPETKRDEEQEKWLLGCGCEDWEGLL